MEPDRRRQVRKVPEKFAFIQIERDEVGKVLNVSEGGLSFCSFAPIPQNGPLYFWMSFNLRDRIEAMAEVAWTDSSRKIGGLKFLHQSQISREQLRQWLAQMPSEQALFEEAFQRALLKNVQAGARNGEPDRVARFVAKARSTFVTIPLEPQEDPPKIPSSTALASRDGSFTESAGLPRRTPSFGPPPERDTASAMELPKASRFSPPTPTTAEVLTESPRASRFAALTLLGVEPAPRERQKAPDFPAPALRRTETPVGRARNSRFAPPTPGAIERPTEPPKDSGRVAPGPREAESALWPPRGSFSGATSTFTSATLRGIESAMELVSLQRHLSAKKRQLIVGVLLGILLSASVAFTTIRYKKYRAQVENAATPPTESSIAKDPVASQKSGLSTESTPNLPFAGVRPPGTKNPAPVQELGHGKQVTNSYEQGSPFDAGSPPAITGRKPARTSIPLQSSGARAAGKKMTATQLWASVQAGNSEAAVDLAELYIKGQGVARNCQQARVLLLMASEKRNTAAIKRLHELDKNTTACP